VCKRIARRLNEIGLANLDEYRARLEVAPEEWKALDRCCRVTISRFFRDREVFRVLQDDVLPGLAERAGVDGCSDILCWSAGCGSGEEPYTLSLLWRLPRDGEGGDALSEQFPGLSLRVTATDADPLLLERAANAVYPRGTLKELPGEWVPAAFQELDGGFRLKPEFRKDVRFREMDIREAAPQGTFDLILCRNLAFTYFEEDLQAEVLESLLDRLHAGGVLVMGGHESPPQGPWPLARMKRGLPVFRREGPLEP
jgi:chemotaxis protein methyltransferase CheR